MGDYFKYRYIPSPKSIWKNVRKLPHGHYAVFHLKNNTLDIRKYYSLEKRILDSGHSSVEEVEYLLSESVKRRLISDVEVGTLLSGGLDSSSVSAIAASYHQNIKSFSIGFEPEEYSELPFAKITGDFIKTVI